jgi:hypothetical protein
MRVAIRVSEMNCNQLSNCIDAYMDGELPQDARAALDLHVSGCAACGALRAHELRLQRALKAQPVVEPGADALERALSIAAHTGARRTGVRRNVGIGAALAAGLAVVAVIGSLRQPAPVTSAPAQLASVPAPVPAATPAAVAPESRVTLTRTQTRTIQLVFGTRAELNDARLILSLPPGVELAGRSGQREVRWRTSLQRGNNVLPLELVVREGTGGEIVARLEHGSRHKTFRVRVTVDPDQHDSSTTIGSNV